MKKIAIYLSSFLFLAGCQQDFEVIEFNIEDGVYVWATIYSKSKKDELIIVYVKAGSAEICPRTHNKSGEIVTTIRFPCADISLISPEKLSVHAVRFESASDSLKRRAEPLS